MTNIELLDYLEDKIDVIISNSIKGECKLVESKGKLNEKEIHNKKHVKRLSSHSNG